MNTKAIWKKTGALTLAAMVAFGLVGCGSAANAAKETNTTASAVTDNEKLETALTSTSFGKSDGDPGKEETVYILTDASGNISDVTVSDWLKNSKGEDTISDVSTLTDIKNVKGEETYTTGSDNQLTWAAGGNDIYYQGKTDASLPVSVKVSYKLDGNDITPEELSGKSGKVTIRFDYENNTKETVDVNGSKVTVPVPFAMVSGVILPTDNYAHVEVTNGKVISDADSNIVMGVALPGLSDIDSDMDKLTDSMQQLRDGGSELADGAKSLSDGAQSLSDGVTAYTDGVGTLSDGAKTLNSKMSELTAGTQSMADGAKKLSDAVASGQTSMKDLNDLVASYAAIHNALNSGTFKSDMDTAKALAAKSASLTTFQQQFASMSDDEKFQYVYSQMSDEQKKAFNDQVEAATKLAVQQAAAQIMQQKGVSQLDEATLGAITEQCKAEVLKQAAPKAVEAAVAQMQTEAENAKTQSTSAAQATAPSRGYEALASGGSLSGNDQTWLGLTGMTETEWNYLATWATVADSSTSTAAEYIAKYTAFETKYGKLAAMADSLKSQMSALAEGTKQLSDGAAQLNDSVQKQLAPGVSRLSDGAGTLDANSAQLTDGLAQLVEGSVSLAQGAQELSDGLVKFDEEGIQKLADLTGTDVTTLTNKLTALQKAGDNYNNFSGAADGVQSSVKFVFETEAVDKDDSNS